MKTGLIAIACLSGLAMAQAKDSPSAAVRQACRADMQKLCAGVAPGGGRVKQCFAEHKDQLSPDCRDALQKAQAGKSGG